MATIVRSRFHLLLALALAAIVLGGFARTYYLRVFLEVPPITRLVHLHGLLFTAWFTLFLVQARLIAAHRVRAHMQLGVAGAVLAAAVFAVSIVTTFAGMHDTRPRPMGFDGLRFSIFPLVTIGLFGVFVACALALRRHGPLHTRFMALAMIAAVGPAAARLLLLAHAQAHFFVAQVTVTAALVAWCMLADWRRHRAVHVVYWLGGVALVLSWPLRVAIARSDWWVALVR